MDLHIYTRELLDKHLLPDLKEIAQALGINPEGNKTRRETWVAALVGQPFPIFQAIEVQRQEPIENSPAVSSAQDIVESWTTWEKEHCAWLSEAKWCVYKGENKRIEAFLPTSKTVRLEGMKQGVEYCQIWEVSECTYDGSGNPLAVSSSLYPEEPIENCVGVDRVQEPIGNSPGVEVDSVGIRNTDYLNCPKCKTVRGLYPVCPGEKTAWETRCIGCDYVGYGIGHPFEDVRPFEGDRIKEPIENPLDADLPQEPIEKSLDVDLPQESLEFPDLNSALAEIARLRAQNSELLELVRRAKDISPVEKPSLKRVVALARAACFDVSKNVEGKWTLSMGHLKRSFKKLRDIWDLLITDDWYLMDLFSPPSSPQSAVKPLFTRNHSKYSAVPFADDGLIDSWSLGVNAVSSGRSPPAGGDAM